MAPIRQIAGMAAVVLLGLIVGVLVTVQLTNHISRAAAQQHQHQHLAEADTSASASASAPSSLDKVPASVEGGVGMQQERVKMLEQKHSLLRGQLDLVAAELEEARSQLTAAAPAPQQKQPVTAPARAVAAAAAAAAKPDVIVVEAASKPLAKPATASAAAASPPSPPPPPPGSSLLVKRPSSKTAPLASTPASAPTPSTASASASASASALAPTALVAAPVPAALSPAKPKTTTTTTTTTSSSASSSSSSSSSACPYDFKVYVYPLPPALDSVRLGDEARRNRTLHVCQKCILEQFALEYIIQDFFTQFCGRTYKPEEADFFYLPVVRDAEYRVRMEERNNPKKRNPSPVEAALLLLMEKNDSSLWKSVLQQPDTYWRRRGGGDHILAMPAPITNLRHESSMRGFFHYMSHLHTPIFLGVEYSISFVREYPVCATEKNIVVPYPTTDPDLFSGKLHAEHIKRDSLLYYAGGLHGECMEIRRALRQLMVNATRMDSHVVPSARATMAEREHGFLQATFCPVPVGDSPSSKRMYDVMHFGCIPVVISDDLVFAYSLETGGPIDAREFAIQLPQSIVQFPVDVLLKKFGGPKGRTLWGHLPNGDSLFALLQKASTLPAFEKGIYVNPIVHILRLVSPENVATLQKGVARWSGAYRFYKMDKSMTTIPTATRKLPDGDAIEQLAAALSRRKNSPGGIYNLTARCQAERFRKGHKYIARHPCDKDDHTSLKRRRLLAVDADVDTQFARLWVGEGEGEGEDEGEDEQDCARFITSLPPPNYQGALPPPGGCQFCGDWKL